MMHVAEAIWGHSVAELCEDAMGLDPEFARFQQEVSQ
jgi:hypothetical protein